MEAADKRPVKVTLFGQSYTLLAPGDTKEVERIAKQVDELLHDISRKAPNADSSRVAVLACMHLADKLDQLEKSVDAIKARINRRSEELSEILDRAFESEG